MGRPRSASAWCAVLVAAACGGSAERSAGPGLTLHEADDHAELALDPSAGVPTVPFCSKGELLTRTRDGFRCVPLLDTVLDGPVATVDDTNRLEAKVAALEEAVAPPCGPPGRSVRPEFEVPATKCLPWSAPGAPRRIWWSLGPLLKFRYEGGAPAVGTFYATCALQPSCGPWDGVWNRVTIYYLDPDGTSPDHDLRVSLMEGDHVLGACLDGPCSIRTSQLEATDLTTVALPLRAFRPDLARARRDPSYYRVEVEFMNNVRGGGELQFYGFRID